jgi:acetyltransferase-like isoleucine patch superfamily enzyme
MVRDTLKRGPLGPPIRRLRQMTKNPREGLRLLFTLMLGSLPSRSVRTFLARRVLGLKADPGSVVYRWRDLRAPAKIEIGAGTVVGFWSTLDGRRGLKIGKNVNLSSEVALWTLQHDPGDRGFGVRGGPIVIEDLAWISFRATVLPGVRIGEGAVVAANSVVTEDVAEYTIVGGIPAQAIGERPRDLDYSLADSAPWFV